MKGSRQRRTRPPQPLDALARASATTPHGAPIARHFAVILIGRTVLNTAHRIIYPFLPAIARGLGISLGAAGSLVTLRMLAGLAAPALGDLADRQGRRRMMELGLGLLVIACLLLAAVGSHQAAILAFILFGLAKVLYDPSVHAYVADLVPYAQRGRAMGIVELSWSAAWLAGVPLAGYLIDSHGWEAPWFLLLGLGIIGLALTRFLLPRTTPPTPQSGYTSRAPATPGRLRSLLRQPGVLALLGASLTLTLANEIPFIVYGAWIEESYGLSLTALGLASVLLGISEAAAEFGTTLLTDRWGKRKSFLLGLLAMAGAMLILPGLAQLGFGATVTGLVLMIFFFEFAIVSMLPLVTQIVPNARALMLSLNIAAMSLGRLLGGTAGSWIWQWNPSGIDRHAFIGAALAALSAAMVAFGTKEPLESDLPDAH